jgi:hypothetical protein
MWALHRVVSERAGAIRFALTAKERRAERTGGFRGEDLDRFVTAIDALN